MLKVRSSFPLARSQSFSSVRELPERPRFGRPGRWRRSPGRPGEGAQLFSAGQVPELQRLVPIVPERRGSAVRGNGDAVTRSECPVKVRSSFPLARSQSFSVLSLLAESAVRPSGAMATLVMPRSECPVKVASSFPVARSQSFSVLSRLPETAVRPSGAMATLLTRPFPTMPGEGASSFPLARSQSFSVLSVLPRAARFGRPGRWRRCSPNRSAR